MKRRLSVCSGPLHNVECEERKERKKERNEEGQREIGRKKKND
jgi:hypothetical protein